MIAQKIGTSTTCLMLYKRTYYAKKSNEIKCSENSIWLLIFLSWLDLSQWENCKRHICQELIFAFPLLTSGYRLWKITILFWTDKKCQCFLIKRWLNSIILGISKLKSLALLIDNFSMLQDNNDLHLIGSKLKLWYIFLFKSSNFGKVKSINRNF